MTYISRHTPRGFPASQSFHPNEVTWFSISAMTNQLSKAKPTTKDSNASSATPTEPNDKQTRSDNSPQTTLAMLSTWSEISSSTRHQALMWLSPWQT